MSDRVYATPPGVNLGPLAQIADGAARNFVLQLRAGRFHGFVVRQGETVHGYVDRCPHAGLPLAQRLDDYLTPARDLIACSWHGALFRVEDGTCVGGPCVGQRLTPWAVAVENGQIVTAAAPSGAPARSPGRTEEDAMPDTDKTNAEAKQNADEIKDIDATRRGSRGADDTEPPEPTDTPMPPPFPH